MGGILRGADYAKMDDGLEDRLTYLINANINTAPPINGSHALAKRSK